MDDQAGASVAEGTDWDLDGQPEIAIGAGGTDAADGATMAGSVYVFRSPLDLDGDDLPLEGDLVINSPYTGAAKDARYGARVVWAGSLDDDADGYPVLAVSAPTWSDTDTSWRGAVDLLQGPDGSSSLSLQGEDARGLMGNGLAGGDGDGDGQADLVVGADYLNSYQGRTYVLLGPVTSNAEVGSRSDVTITGGASDYGSGSAVAFGGDTDGDGGDDLLIGGYGTGTSSAGAAWLFRAVDGSSAALATGDADVTWTGQSGDYAGSMVGGAGDVNGDGLADLLVSAPYRNGYSGVVYLLSGAASVSQPLDDGYSVRFDGLYAGAVVGNAPTTAIPAGDVDADGFGDLWISAVDDTFTGGESSVGPGRVYLVRGGGSDFSGVQGLEDAELVFVGESEGDCTGSSLSVAGDVNGDGCPDLLIGAEQYKVAAYETVTDPGEAWLVSTCAP